MAQSHLRIQDALWLVAFAAIMLGAFACYYLMTAPKPRPKGSTKQVLPTSHEPTTAPQHPA